jgi:5-methylcytosine-specific restriction endonuclease McrA
MSANQGRRVSVAIEFDDGLAIKAETMLPNMVGRGTRGQRGLLRAFLTHRDGPLCCWCHEPMVKPNKPGDQFNPECETIEHIIPISEGGENALTNMALAHRRCNLRRNHQALRAKQAATRPDTTGRQ